MKKKRFSLIVCFATLLALAPTLGAQAVYTATRSSRIQAGVGVSLIEPDYQPTNVGDTSTNYGASAWGDFDLTKWYGLEVGAHIDVVTPQDYAENSFQVGIRGTYHYRKFTIYPKLMAGLAKLTPQDYRVTALHETSTSYAFYSIGGGLEYRLTPKLNIRAIDFEVQQWTNFEPHTLSPIIATIGVSYVIH